ncbi:MAG: glycosyl hydrolase 53 family protein [Prevotella sp.]|nr:glycosyl hydrolase 53 family protein [Prevotella sp.]
MRRLTTTLLLSITLATCALAASLAANAQSQRYLGGDLSLLPSYEEQGTVYRDYEGRAVEPLQFLKQQGWDAVRVRLFVEPEYAPKMHQEEGVCQDLDYVLRFSKRIQQAAMKLMLDFHYSDYWADPGKQTMPHLWQGARRQDLPDSVYQYTRRTLTALKCQGVVPDMIQVGNEITNGMLWPEGKIAWGKENEQQSWDYLCQLLTAGCRACREVCPQARIIIHTEKAGRWDVTKTYYQQLRRHQVDYDIIGLSYYPMWHGTIPNLGQNLDRLQWLFPDKEVMIVETAAYYSHENDQWATPDKYAEFYPISIEGQELFTRELVDELRRHWNVRGLFWWFAEENACGNTLLPSWVNRGLFDNHTGHALPALKAFSQFNAE